jgi:hypothetical protein
MDRSDAPQGLRCSRCEREGRYSVARLLFKHGDAWLTNQRNFLTVVCAQRAHKSADWRLFPR